MSIVKYHFNRSFDEDSVYFFRFITHLKFLSQRLISGSLHIDHDKKLHIAIKKSYPGCYHCAEKINTFLQKKYQYQLTNEELSYLT
ncbi:PRD domain-containing protein, partial [Enterococcus sp.]|uniref:PRD domain-containing protein n=1 Tax=Enterococcus sp. TaxID=35783 RepID=UPI0025C4CB96